MITKQYIGSTARVSGWLTGYFSEVQLESNTITCEDNDGNTFFQISAASNEINENIDFTPI